MFATVGTLTDEERRAAYIVGALRSSARRRGFECTLLIGDIIRLRFTDEGMRCHYCGGALGQRAPSLDRIDNDRGYTPNNVVPCCLPLPCNTARNNLLTYDEFKAAMRVRIARTGAGKAWPRKALEYARLDRARHQQRTRTRR